MTTIVRECGECKHAGYRFTRSGINRPSAEYDSSEWWALCEKFKKQLPANDVRGCFELRDPRDIREAVLFAREVIDVERSDT